MQAETLKTITAVVHAHADQPGAMLPVLHALQDACGYVPAAAIPVIADALKLSRAEVHGVISFYHHFRTAPAGRHVVQVCRAEACQAVGAQRLEAHVQRVLGCDWHQTSADRAVTLEPVYCLGNCACGPSLRIDDELLGRVDPASFDALLAGLRADPQAHEQARAGSAS